MYIKEVILKQNVVQLNQNVYKSFRLLEGGTLDPSKGRGVDSGRCVHLKGGGKRMFQNLSPEME